MFSKFRNKNEEVIIQAFSKGTIVPLEQVPDPMFSEMMLGDGIAIQLSSDLVCSPCDGEIIFVANTKHAIGIRMSNGLELLIHIGLDTVKLDGKGFTVYCEAEQKVKAGEKLVKIDAELFEDKNINLISMLVFTNLNEFTIKTKNHGYTYEQNNLLILEK